MLSSDQVVLEHNSLVKQFGGSMGINYGGIIDSAVEKFNSNSDKKEAAIEFFYDIIIGHPFVDGNKRTAVHFLEHLLELNGFSLIASNNQIVAMALHVTRENEISHKSKGVQVSLEYVRKFVSSFIK